MFMDMQEMVRKLQALQELEITCHEATIVHGEPHADSVALRQRVQALRQELDVDVLGRYDRLAKHGLAVVQVVNNLCAGCNLSVPQGDLNRMRSGRMEPICPHCGAFLVL